MYHPYHRFADIIELNTLICIKFQNRNLHENKHFSVYFGQILSKSKKRPNFHKAAFWPLLSALKFILDIKSEAGS